MTRKVLASPLFSVAIVLLVFAGLAYWLSTVMEEVMFEARPAHTEHMRRRLDPLFRPLKERIEVVRVNQDIDAYYFVIRNCDLDEVTGLMDEAEWSYEPDRTSGMTRIVTNQPDEENSMDILVFEQLSEKLVYGGAIFFGRSSASETEAFWKSYENDKEYAR